MLEFKANIRKFGKYSKGVLIPANLVKKHNLVINRRVIVRILKQPIKRKDLK